MKYDTIIIGAGMSGLAAGIRLAHYEQKVCILERHTTIGGLNSFYRMRGHNHDVGLHAVTNFTPKGAKKGPLARLLRQLRFNWDDFALSPQIGSRVAFPGVDLRFNNDIGLFRSEVAKQFPSQKDNFERLLGKIVDYDDLNMELFELSTRQMLAETITDPLLVEMLLCPCMWYGNAREDDMDWGLFSVIFRSIFLEGMARPLAGVRLILKNLVRRFRDLGGELKLRSGVSRIKVDGDRAAGVVLDSGVELEGNVILSSAGAHETLKMCDDISTAEPIRVGQLSFSETISILDRSPKELGYGETVVFFNDSDRFHWRRPEGQLCDVRTGVICSPNNYAYDNNEGLDAGYIRSTALSDFSAWQQLPEEEYRLAKLRWYDRMVESVVRFIPDYRNHVIDTDMFTPTTLRRFTSHDNGTIYGSPKKALDGSTHLKNVFICGTDQGFLGIIGALTSGIAMANLHCLRV